MTFFNLTSGEMVLLVVLGVLILGPKNLPRYAAQLGDWVRQLRAMADGAKTQIKQEMGPAFDDIDWRQLDPRQYDPRRIVREALMDPAPAKPTDRPRASSEGTPGSVSAVTPPPGALQTYDPDLSTPFDPEAT